MRFSVVCLVILSSFLTACAVAGERVPTPTIVRLERSTGEAAGQAQVDDAPPTATRVPQPSPSATVEAEALAASEIQEPADGEVETDAEVEAQNANPAAAMAEVIVSALNVREGPGLDYRVLGVARQGDVFEVIGVDQFGYWYRVTLAEDSVGWISAGSEFTRLAVGEEGELPVVEAAAAPAGVAVTPTPAPSSTPQPVSQADETDERLIFTTSSGGNLYVINLDGTGLRQLAGGVIDPVVSPDGKQVAFTRWDSAEFGALFTVNVEDGRERVILGDIRQPKSPTWSPDGEQIVISYQQGGIRDPKRECKRFKFGEDVRVPDGAMIDSVDVIGEKDTLEICFVRKEDLQWILRQIDVSTGEFEDLATDIYAYNPTWSPASPQRVIYDGEKGLVQFDVAAEQQSLLTDDVRDTGPVFAPDGRRLALTYRQHDHWEVYTLDLETGARHRLTKPPILADPQYNSAAPTWSPDGSQIAFLTDRTGEWEIWVMNADGSEQQPLFGPEVQAQLALDYWGMNERMLNWIE